MASAQTHALHSSVASRWPSKPNCNLFCAHRSKEDARPCSKQWRCNEGWLAVSAKRHTDTHDECDGWLPIKKADCVIFQETRASCLSHTHAFIVHIEPVGAVHVYVLVIPGYYHCVMELTKKEATEAIAAVCVSGMHSKAHVHRTAYSTHIRTYSLRVHVS